MYCPRDIHCWSRYTCYILLVILNVVIIWLYNHNRDIDQCDITIYDLFKWFYYNINLFYNYFVILDVVNIWLYNLCFCDIDKYDITIWDLTKCFNYINNLFFNYMMIYHSFFFFRQYVVMLWWYDHIITKYSFE